MENLAAKRTEASNKQYYVSCVDLPAFIVGREASPISEETK